MPSKPVLSWSKRQTGSESSSRTGLLDTLKRRPSKLATKPADGKQDTSSQSATRHNAALTGAVDNLHVAVNGMLRSSGPTDTLCSRSSSIHKPLPSRPRSTSIPLLVELPAELPDSTFLECQDRSLFLAPVVTTTGQVIQNERHHPKMQPGYEKVAVATSKPALPTLAHNRSVPELSSRYSLTRTTRTSKISVPSATAQSDLRGVHRNNSLANTVLQRHPESNLMKSLPTATGNDFIKRASRISDREIERRKSSTEVTSSKPSRTATHSKHKHEPHSTETGQQQTTSASQAQFDTPRLAHGSHVETLKRSHSMQIASLENQARLLKERTDKKSLHERTGNDCMAGIGSNDSLHISVCESVEKKPTNVKPRDLSTTLQDQLAAQQHSLQHPGASPEMGNLKRKLSMRRRPETATQELDLEFDLHAKNNAALRKQIDSFTTKLTDLNKNDRELKIALGTAEMKRAEWEDKARHADKLDEKIQALQDTVAHLEARLEIANAKRLDAEEQLSNWKDKKSPFDLPIVKLDTSFDTNQAASGAQISIGTEPPGKVAGIPGAGSSENTTLNAIASHLEQLQAQVAEKNICIAELEAKCEQLQQKNSQLEQEHKRIAVQSDLQDELLKETHASGKVIKQLRTAVIDRESTIMENEETIHTLRRQLEYYKLLLQAEIRRHTAMKLCVTEEEHALPELTSLAKREDIDCWIEKLHERLRNEQPKNRVKACVDTSEARIESLRHEIDFYVREIILFKLDIKGYRSDIRKLKETTAHKDSSEETSDVIRTASSLEVAASPVQSIFAPITPELDAFLDTSSALDHTDVASRSEYCVAPPSPVNSHTNRAMGDNQVILDLEMPQIIRSPKYNSSFANEADRIDSAISSPPNAPHKISKAEWETASYRRTIFMSDAPESPPRRQFDMPNSSNSSEQVAPIPLGHYERTAVSPAPKSPTTSLSETDSVLSTASDYLVHLTPLSERKLSNASASSMPLEVAVEPPPKPVIVAPSIVNHAKGCSITRGVPYTTTPFVSEMDETMPSSTYSNATVPHTKIWQEDTLTISDMTLSSPYMLEQGESQLTGLPSMLSHLRAESASSIYSVDNVSKCSGEHEEQSFATSGNDVISMLKSLQSCPFTLRPSSSSLSIQNYA